MSDSKVRLALRGIVKRYPTIVANDGVDLTVRVGEIHALLGENGAGKSTLVKIAYGVTRPDEGSIEWEGRKVSLPSPAAARQLGIGMVFQHFSLFETLTVSENIAFYADIYSVPKSELATRTERLLGFSNLTPFKHRRAGNLSGGMKQKLGLACALIHTPRVLFLDEPTNGVDPVSRRDFWRILYQLVRDGVTIFVSTAYLDEAERCNRLALLHEGRLLGVGTPDEIKGLMTGALLEVRTSAPRRTAALLRERLTSASVGLFGDRVHVVTRDPAATERQTRELVAAAGFQLVSIRSVEPSLEDVFVSVLATQAAAGPATAPGAATARSDDT